MKRESNVRTATLKDLWQVFLRSLWLMAAAAVLCCAAGLVLRDRDAGDADKADA